jgi:hypothetical protein
MTPTKADSVTKISQIAIVVRDLDATMKKLHETLGWGPWNVYEHKPPSLHHTHLRGQPTAFSMLGAEAHVGDVIVELIQPLDGPSIYKEFLDKHGEGLQHIACMRHTRAESDAFKERLRAEGAEVLMGGRIGETIEFYYLDTEPMLKFVLESGSGHAIDLKPARVYP